jgi:predicted CXXCH cytochrome family protein
MDCSSCHGDADDATGPVNGYEQSRFYGPHGGYMTTTSKCQNCHSVHKSPADSVLLLPAATIKATCETCHDGTGGWGVYGTIRQRTYADPGGGHRIDTTNVVPGGDAVTGGSRMQTFSGTGGFLTCTDCHSPHGAEVVDPFLGDRLRIRKDHPAIRSTRLLRQRPTGSAAGTTRYGSDWCLACHEGSGSGGMAMNHPVESSLVTTLTTPYDYDNVPVLSSEDPVSTTVLQTMGGIPTGAIAHDWPVPSDAAGNRGYLMPYPRTDEQQGRGPICQQCHEDSRSSVGQLVGDGSIGDAAPAESDPDAVWWDSTASTWTADGAYDNPRFQNFPHETENRRMLVEEYDDLCLNCHPVSQLP